MPMYIVVLGKDGIGSSHPTQEELLKAYPDSVEVRESVWLVAAEDGAIHNTFFASGGEEDERLLAQLDPRAINYFGFTDEASAFIEKHRQVAFRKPSPEERPS